MRLWPTPTASDHRGAQRVNSCKRWRSRGRNLPEAVVLAEAWEHSVTLAPMEYVFVTMDEEGVLSEQALVPVEVPPPTTLAQHTIDNTTTISTAFTPLCLRSESGAPQPFETAVVRGHKSTIVARHTDLHTALTTHDEVVRRHSPL